METQNLCVNFCDRNTSMKLRILSIRIYALTISAFKYIPLSLRNDISRLPRVAIIVHINRCHDKGTHGSLEPVPREILKRVVFVSTFVRRFFAEIQLSKDFYS